MKKKKNCFTIYQSMHPRKTARGASQQRHPHKEGKKKVIHQSITPKKIGRGTGHTNLNNNKK
jgi:hypothetical protein